MNSGRGDNCGLGLDLGLSLRARAKAGNRGAARYLRLALLLSLFPAGAAWAAAPLAATDVPPATVQDAARDMTRDMAQDKAQDKGSAASGLALPVWRELLFEDSRLWASASSQIRLHTVPAEHFREQRLAPPELSGTGSARAPGGDVLALMIDNRVVRNRERISAWIDLGDGGLLQRCRLSEGRSRSRAQCYSYFEQGVSRERREGANLRGQWSTDDPDSISGLIRDWRATSLFALTPPRQPDSAAWLPVQALLLVAGDGRWAQLGEQRSARVHTDRDFFDVTLTWSGHETLRVRHELRVGQSTQRVEATVEARVISIEASPLAPADEDFEFFGLRAPLSLLIDPDTGLPLEVRGVAPRLGATGIGLRAARLASDKPARTSP